MALVNTVLFIRGKECGGCSWPAVPGRVDAGLPWAKRRKDVSATGPGRGRSPPRVTLWGGIWLVWLISPASAYLMNCPGLLLWINTFERCWAAASGLLISSFPCFAKLCWAEWLPRPPSLPSPSSHKRGLVFLVLTCKPWVFLLDYINVLSLESHSKHSGPSVKIDLCCGVKWGHRDPTGPL